MEKKAAFAFLSLIACIMVCLQFSGINSMDAHAEYIEGDGTIYGNYDAVESDSEVMDITLTVENAYSVKIPKVLDITSSDPSYMVEVTGSLAENYVLKVQPEENALFWNDNGDEFNAPVTQAKVYWTQEDLEATGRSVVSGTFDITGIKSGVWQGSLYFDIELLYGAE